MRVVMGDLRPRLGARLRREDRRGHAAGGAGRRARDRGVSRQGRGRGHEAAGPLMSSNGTRADPRDRGRPHLLRLDPRAQGDLARGAGGRDRDAARRERRRQVDDAALDQRAPAARARARSASRGGTSRTTPAHEIVKRGIAQSPEGRRLFPRMTVTENLEMGAFQRSDKAGIKEDMERVFELFPRLQERRDAEGRDDVGRRAADVRDRARADGAAEAAAARRAVARARADLRRADLRDRRRRSTSRAPRSCSSSRTR